MDVWYKKLGYYENPFLINPMRETTQFYGNEKQLEDVLYYIESGSILFLEGAKGTGKTKFLRPRVFAYIAILIVMCSAFIYTVANRKPLTIDVSRDRGAQMFRVRSGQIQNVYMIKINNMDRQAHEFIVEVDSDQPFTLGKSKKVELDEGEIFSIPVRVSIPQDALTSIASEIKFIVRATDNDAISAQEMATFIGPSVTPAEVSK